jgi:hypothetical protein
MLKRYIQPFFFLACLFSHTTFAEDRALLYPEKVSGKLQEVVEALLNPATAKVEGAKLSQPNRYFARLAPRKHIMTADNKIADNAILGTKPFVFMTTPESFYGKGLLDIYLDIGYEAEDIIRWQRDEPMVAVIYRYADDIQLSAVRDGKLPENWEKSVFSPTWDNVLSLLEKLSVNAPVTPDKQGEFAPTALFFKSDAEKQLALTFPEASKQRVKTTDYAVLKANGGQDWAYRDLLERKLSIFEHFRGTGRTLNEVVDPTGKIPESGVYEFVAPNAKVNTLPEVAVVYLGKLSVLDR